MLAGQPARLPGKEDLLVLPNQLAVFVQQALIPYSWQTTLENSAFPAPSVQTLSLIHSFALFHGIGGPFTPGSAFKSGTYVLNLLCYLCPDYAVER